MAPKDGIFPLTFTILTAELNHIHSIIVKEYRCSYNLPFVKNEVKGKLNFANYLIAVILVIAWAIGFFAFNAGYLIHILLVIAIIAILLRVIRGS